MAIPNKYIDKIKDKDSGESRPICPPAEHVSVDNENFEGETLDEVLGEVARSIEEAGQGGYAPPAGGIPKTDLAQSVQDSLDKADSALQDEDVAEVAKTGSYNDLENKPTIPDTSNLATKQQLATKQDAIVAGNGIVIAQDGKTVSVGNTIATKSDIPHDISDLNNDAGYVTQEALAGIVAGNADIMITEDDNKIYITAVVPTISVSPAALVLSASNKSGTITVSGNNLKGNVTLNVPQGWSASETTLVPTNGTLAATQVTLTYNGSTDSLNNELTISSQGATAKTVPLSYTVYAGPTIIVSESALSMSAVAGQSVVQQLVVGASQLTDGITAAISGTNASKFSVSPATLPTSGGTLTITYNPAAGDSGAQTATLTLSSTGATSKTVTLNGTALVQSLTIEPSMLDLVSGAGVSASGTLTIKGENLVGTIALNSSSAGYSLSPETIAASDINAAGSTGVQVAVTRSADATSATTTITASNDNVTATANVSWTETEATPAVGDYIVKNGLHYYVQSLPSGSTNGTLRVANPAHENASSTKSTYTGNVVIPSTVTYAEETYTVNGILSHAFREADITSVTIPATVSSMGGSAFYKAKMATVNWDAASTVGEIAEKAFQSCPNLTSISVPNSTTSLGTYTFNYCGSLTSVVIGAPGATTGASNEVNFRTAFAASANGNGTDAITSITINKTVKAKLSGAYFSSTVFSNATLYVPANLVSAYRSDSNWGNFTHIEAIPTNE